MTFGGKELYPTIIEKASALGFSIVINHPFIDGNKRAGHAAMEIFLVLNRIELIASEVDAASFFVELAASMETQPGAMSKLVNWLQINSEI